MKPLWMKKEYQEQMELCMYMPGKEAVFGGCETLLITAIFGGLKYLNQRTTRSRESNSGSWAGFKIVRAVIIYNRSGYLMGWEPRVDALCKPP
jgi:hypothetical protein